MDLCETFEAIGPCIVGLGTRHDTTQSPSEAPPPFPKLWGTGFVVDPRGIVITNKHVAEPLQELPASPVTKKPYAFAMICKQTVLADGGPVLGIFFVDIKRYWIPSEFSSKGPYYGEALPDLAFIQLNVRDLPSVELASGPGVLRLGLPIATAGFPLGRDALLEDGRVVQPMPTLRHGIVSGLSPFPCPAPSGFSIDAMVQGGASGSPVFLANSPLVVGMIRSGFPGTNFTYALPSSLLAVALKILLESETIDFESIPTLAEVVSKSNPNSNPNWRRVPPIPTQISGEQK
jgi:S1-C subfamily serine protease